MKEQIATYSFSHARAHIHQQAHMQQVGQRASQSRHTRLPKQHDTFDDEDIIYETRTPNSTRHYQPIQGPSHVVVHDHRSQRYAQQTVTQTITKQKHHPLVLVGAGMALMFCLWVASSIVVNWWIIVHDDVTYGRPRISQADAVVGHGSASSHFIVVNLHRHIQVFEIPGGDPTHPKMYDGPVLTGDGQELTPATLEFKDINNDNRLDMIIKAGNSRFVFINDKGAFRPLRAGEQVSL